MKKIFKAVAVIICLMLCTCANAQTLTVKFTGRDQTGQHYVKLDHVKTFNLDQLWEEVLYFPDTTLVLGGVGIIDYGNPSNSQLEQNVPNPFNGTTHFTIYLREGAGALLEIFDLMGKTVISQYYANLSAGAHLFSANLTNPQVYILKVSIKNEQMHLKMVNEGFGTENSINYVSVAAQSNDFGSEAKNGQAMGIYPFHNGDELQHTGYTVINGVEYQSETITQRQNESETLILPFNLTPTVITNEVSNITSSSAVCGGSVSYTGEATIVNRGVCWSTSPNPTINDHPTFDGNGIGSFTSNIIGLTPGTTYYVRAYATSSANITGYGEQVTFNTLATIPSVTTSVVSNITDNSATCGGNVSFDGGATVTSRGVCWSTSQNPTIADNHSNDGSDTGVFTSIITGLVPNTTYYVRAYATNSEGTSYGEQRTLNTLCNVVNITVSGNTNINYGQSTTLTASGANSYQWSTNATTASITVSPTSNTTYTVVGTNNYSCTGSASVIVTINTAPTVTTHVISNIGTSAATCGGNVTSDGGATVTARGVCWSTSQNPTINNSHTTNGTGTGNFSSNITGLTPNTTYYVRAYATNSVGTSYGNQISFIPVSFICGSSTINDFDGNSYNTVSIGSQCWLKENLRSMHYANGTAIALGTTTSTTTGYRYYPNNDSSIVSSYGFLYNWKATMRNSLSSNTNPSGVQGICPNGWHLPSKAEWSNLFQYVSGQSQYVCGNSTSNTAKSYASTTGWHISSGECHVGNIPENNNATGFSVLPAGTFGYSNYGTLINSRYGENAYCWGSTENEENVDEAISFHLDYNHSYTGYMALSKSTARSVRCLRDETAIDGQPCLGTETISDYDGNNYPTVHLGSQCWMAKNLRTTHYSNGTSIALGTDSSSNIPYRYYPNNNASNISLYGYLYNWSAAMGGYASSYSNPSGVQGICPDNWHIPSSAEWDQLQSYLGNQSQYLCNIHGYTSEIAKALASTSGWETSSTSCHIGNDQSSNNSTGFTARPAGNGTGYDFNNYGRSVTFWTSTQNNNFEINIRRLWNDNASLLTYWGNYTHMGYSVRCVRNEDGSSTTQLPSVTTSAASNITENTATCGGNVTSDGGATVTARGVCWSTSQNPTINDSHTTNGSGTGSFTSNLTGLTAGTTYYVRAYAINSAGTAYGNEVSFTTTGSTMQDGQPCPGVATVTDIDNNTYNTVQIGNQCWMKENLRTTHYTNGTPIEGSVSTSTTTPYFYTLGTSNVTYGVLYNWAAVMNGASSSSFNPSGIQGICPIGWHVPSDAEWGQLFDYVSQQNEYCCGSYAYPIAKALSSTSIWWRNSSVSCAVGNNPENNNATNFSIQPAGLFGSNGYGGFSHNDECGSAYFWTSTQHGGTEANHIRIHYNSAYVDFNSHSNKANGCSVRCIRD